MGKIHRQIPPFNACRTSPAFPGQWILAVYKKLCGMTENEATACGLWGAGEEIPASE